MPPTMNDFSLEKAADGLASLNPAQRQAVETVLGPVLVLAGAGSGKTRVLTQRVAYLLEKETLPAEILGVTFTNKAAKEMKHRITQLVGDESSQDLWIGTFHSICGRILRKHIVRYQSKGGRQWQQNFVIFDETESLQVVKDVIKSLNLDDKLYNAKTIRHLISQQKNQLVDAYAYASAAKTFQTEKIALIYDGYEAQLSKNNAIDFDDMLLITTAVLQQCPDVLDQFHCRFRHILVDEFQDTNNAQYELIRLIVEGETDAQRSAERQAALWRNRSFMVVGDVDQSIYSWRGANFRIILDFQRDFPKAQLIKLEENYRSTGHILNLANQIIENNQDRLPKELRSTRGEGEKILCFEAQDDREEALFVIDQLQQITRTGKHKPGDCCILYRTNFQSRALEDVLISKGISYTMIGGLKFYERKEIKDLLAYLTVIFNDADAYSLKRVLNVPKRGIGKTTITHMEEAAGFRNLTLFQILQDIASVEEVKPKAQKAIVQFVAFIQQLKFLAQSTPLDQLLIHILEMSGYYDELKLEDPTDSEGRIANVEEFVSVARQFLIENPNGDLADFLTQMALLSDIDSAEPAENKLVLMTLHAAKGLEYPVVAICGLEEGLFPHFRSLSDKDQMEEERRLMYVGVTRAMDRLILTYARRRMVFGELKYAMPSRFLKECPKEFLHGAYTLDHEQRRQEVYPSSRDDYSGSSGDSKTSDFIRRHAAQAKSRSGENLSNTRSGSSSPSPSPATTARFDVGDRIRHPKFGTGTVDQVIGTSEKILYNVAFDTIAGKKLLDPRFAPLEAI
ncbi:MAG: UvrD-helicase domain-containing protein [Cyanobacteria bacterium]|nr:UvrD-helicase domain-containing protein [Cyanobacteriota bacterium]